MVTIEWHLPFFLTTHFFSFFFICKLTQSRELVAKTCQILFIFITRGWQVKFQVRFHSEAIGEHYAILCVCVFKLQKSSNIG